MPYPQNVETANAVEADRERAAGAVPATIAVSATGVPRVGLDARALGSCWDLAQTCTRSAFRDLPVNDRDAGSTARRRSATTMRIAALAGGAACSRPAEPAACIAERSAALTSAPISLSSRVNRRCGGERGREEHPRHRTHSRTARELGVPVIGYRTREFPAFYSRSRASRRHSLSIARRSRRRDAREMEDGAQAGGILVANPIAPEAEIKRSEIDPIIAQALDDMSGRGIGGKEVTPFLLARIVEITGGRSLEANIALVKSNALLASAIAIAYAAQHSAA